VGPAFQAAAGLRPASSSFYILLRLRWGKEGVIVVSVGQALDPGVISQIAVTGQYPSGRSDRNARFLCTDAFIECSSQPARSIRSCRIRIRIRRDLPEPDFALAIASVVRIERNPPQPSRNRDTWIARPGRSSEPIHW
jgi:hypothetical protein